MKTHKGSILENINFYYVDDNIGLYLGDVLEALKQLPDNYIQCCITSPPYWGLRKYTDDVSTEIGCEDTPSIYVDKLTEIFNEVKRVLKNDGTLWLNLGDSYVSKPTGSLGNSTGEKYGFSKNHKHQSNASKRIDKTGFGLQEKNLIGVPWLVAFSLQKSGWILRQDIIWQKNAMPESVKDRCTKSHEYLFLLTKNQKYMFNHEAIQEKIEEDNDFIQEDLFGNIDIPKTRNKRDVWYIPTEPQKNSHVAPFPTKLVENCLLAGSNSGDVILDIFNGSGTTGLVSKKFNRKYIGIDIKQEYLDLTLERLNLNNNEGLF